MTSDPKPVSSLKTYSRVLAYLKGLIGTFMLSIMGYMLFAASQPMLAKLMEQIISAIEKKDSEARWVLPFVAVLIFLVRGVGSFLGVYFNDYVGASVIKRIKKDVFNHLLVLPAEFYNAASQGQILHRLNNGVDQIQAAVTNALKVVIREGFTVMFLLGYIFYLNWKLSLIFLLISPVLGILVAISTSRMKAVTKKNEKIAGRLLQVSKELISNYGVVRGFGAEAYERKRYSDGLERSFKAQMKARRISAVFGPLSQLIVSAAVSIIIFLLLNPMFLDTTSTGELVGYLTAVALLPKSLQQLSGVNIVIQRGLVGAELVFELLDTPPEKDEGTYEPEKIQGELSVSNLDFRYPGTTRNALSNISFKIKPGEMVALVGRSGSGKSTLASLICRSYHVENNVIFLDGIDINQYRLASLRKHISVVSQNISLFEDTVYNNIAYGETEYSDEQVAQAIRQAHAQEFIQALPEGLNTMIGENGLKLSGGQRQRVSLARAFLKNAPFLILDEATSALDNESEAYVTKALENLAASRTSIVIAHRLSTILKADRLIVMDDGKIVEEGTHKELIEKGGYYSSLYHAEFEQV